MQRSVLHEHGGDRALALVELCFDHRSDRATRRIGLELENVGLKQNLFEQLGDTGALLGRNLRVEGRTAKLLEDDLVLQQVLLHLGHVRRRQVDLVDRDNHRHTGALGVRNRLDRLRHDLVVSGDHQHHNVGDLRTTRTHGGERFVAWCVEERDGPLVGDLHVIGADVLCDPTRFACDHVGFADVVEQRRLTMVDVTHDGDDRRARTKIFDIVDHRRLAREVGGIVAFLHSLESEFAGDQFDLIEVETLIDGDHQPKCLERKADDLCGGNAEDLCEFRHGDELIHTHRLPLTLGGGDALLLHLGAHVGAKTTSTATTRGRAAHGGHRFGDVRRHGFLIDSTTLALFAPTLALRAGGSTRTRRRITRAIAVALHLRR